jgi:DUF4097 and DUF4098 domain-containing protein YvlB
MSAPPPIPPPVPPPFDWRSQGRAQQQFARQQAKFARQKMRAQAQLWRQQHRAMRRRSIAGPIVLIGLGVLFLLVTLGRIPWAESLDWLGQWWPLILIAVGLIAVAEWAFDQRYPRHDAAGNPLPTERRLGGLVGLMMLVVLAGLTLNGGTHLLRDHVYLPGAFDRDYLLRLMGTEHADDAPAIHEALNGRAVSIDNPMGDVTVTGTSTDGQLHMTIHRVLYALTQEDATRLARDFTPTVDDRDGQLHISLPELSGASATLDVTVPAASAVTLTLGSGHGEVSQIKGAVQVDSSHGGVDLSGLGGDAVVNLHDDDASFSAENLHGSLTLNGHAGDMNFSSITGPVALNGEFFGATHAEKLPGGLTFRTHRTSFQAGQVDGSLDISAGSDFTADSLAGPVVLRTSDRNITLDGVSGSLTIENRNGRVAATVAAPLRDVSITNRDGSVDLGIPASSAFTARLTTQHGDLETDFPTLPQLTGLGESKTVTGTVNGGGPNINISTTDGDVTVRKATVLAPVVTLPAPLQPPPPAPKSSHTSSKSPQAETKSAPAAPKPPPAIEHDSF